MNGDLKTRHREINDDEKFKNGLINGVKTNYKEMDYGNKSKIEGISNTQENRSCSNKSKTANMTPVNGKTNRENFCSFNRFSFLENEEINIEHESELLNNTKGAKIVNKYHNKKK